MEVFCAGSRDTSSAKLNINLACYVERGLTRYTPIPRPPPEIVKAKSANGDKTLCLRLIGRSKMATCGTYDYRLVAYLKRG